MSNAVNISGSINTVAGTVKNKNNNEGIVDLHVLVYDKDRFGENDFPGIGVTDATGMFSVRFDASRFRFLKIFDRSPDFYFVIKDGGYELLNTSNNVIDADHASADGPGAVARHFDGTPLIHYKSH